MHSEYQVDNETQFKFIKARYVVLWMVLGMVLFFIFMRMIKGAIGTPEKVVIFGFFFYALISLWIIKNFRKYNINYKKFIGIIPLRYNWLELVQIIFVIIIFSMGFLELKNYILSALDPGILSYIPGASPFYSVKDSQLAPILNFMNFFIAVIIAPIVEEFLFRGVLLHRFTIKWGIRTAILGSSFIFGILHADILGAFIFAFVMCILYIKTSTLIVPIICHMTNNFIASGTEILGTFAPKTYTATPITYTPNLEVALFLILFSGSIILYYLYKNWPKKYWVPPYFRKYEEY